MIAVFILVLNKRLLSAALNDWDIWSCVYISCQFEFGCFCNNRMYLYASLQHQWDPVKQYRMFMTNDISYTWFMPSHNSNSYIIWFLQSYGIIKSSNSLSIHMRINNTHWFPVSNIRLMYGINTTVILTFHARSILLSAYKTIWNRWYRYYTFHKATGLFADRSSLFSVGYFKTTNAIA